MFKKILFLIFLIFCNIAYGQEVNDENLLVEIPEKPLILFNMHVGKTGGSTMNGIITAHYEPSTWLNCVVSPAAQHPYGSLRKVNKNCYMGLSKKQRQNIQYAGGHIALEVLDCFDNVDRVKAFAMIREPRDLLLSAFWYINKDEKYVVEVIDVLNIDQKLINWVKDVSYNNNTIRWFSRNSEVYNPQIPVTEEIFQEAKDNIEKNFLFLGLTERFAESVLMLRRIMDWPFDEKLFHKKTNITKFKMPKSFYDESTFKEIEKNIEFEERLYLWAENRFNTLVKKMGKDFDKEVQMYKRLDSLYQKDHPMFQSELKRVQEFLSKNE